MQKKFLWLAKFLGVLITVIIGLYSILKVYMYLSSDYDSSFLRSKEQIFDGIYHYGFYAHIFTAPLILLMGLLEISAIFRIKHIILHRYIGRIYVFLILFLAAPGGLIMGVYAFGGIGTILSFMFLTPLWWWFTFKAYKNIRKKNIDKHKLFMQRSYILTLSAVFLRVYGLIFMQIHIFDKQTAYIVISWLSWLPNILIFEFFHFRKIQKSKTIKLVSNL